MRFKEYLTESSTDFTPYEDVIHRWMARCVDMDGVTSYTVEKIGDKAFVDVVGDVKLQYRLEEAEKLRVRFRNVTGDFIIGENKITTLEGCPTKVGGSFQAQRNPNLTSYEFLPRESKEITVGRDSCTRLDCIDWSEFSIKEFTLDSWAFQSGGIGLLQIKGLTNLWQYSTGKLTLSPPFVIINRYIYQKRTDQIYDCQAELIEAGFEENAKL